MPPLRGSLVSVELDPLAGAVAPVDQERDGRTADDDVKGGGPSTKPGRTAGEATAVKAGSPSTKKATTKPKTVTPAAQPKPRHCGRNAQAAGRPGGMRLSPAPPLRRVLRQNPN